tara:strand:+ start:120 stop:341 length:222 start_codon:yes stop_codon:yes gene_type:complete
MVKSEQERHSKFRDIGARRTEDIIHRIKLLSNLSNKSNYHYTDDEVNKIFRSIRDELRKAESSFKGADSKFTF